MNQPPFLSASKSLDIAGLLWKMFRKRGVEGCPAVVSVGTLTPLYWNILDIAVHLRACAKCLAFSY